MTRGKSLSGHDWDACPPGTLRQFSAQIRATKRKQTQRRAVRRGGPLLAIALVAVIGSWVAHSTSPPIMNHGGVSCTDVQASFALYASNRLPASVSEQIAEHVRICPTCAAKFRKMRAAPIEDANLGASLEQVAQRRHVQTPQQHSSRIQHASELGLSETSFMLALQQ